MVRGLEDCLGSFELQGVLTKFAAEDCGGKHLHSQHPRKDEYGRRETQDREGKLFAALLMNLVAQAALRKSMETVADREIHVTLREIVVLLCKDHKIHFICQIFSDSDEAHFQELLQNWAKSVGLACREGLKPEERDDDGEPMVAFSPRA